MSALRNCEAIEVPEVGDTSGRDVLKVATRCDLPNSQIYKAELKYVTRSIPTRYPPQGWGGYGGVEVPPSGRDLGWEKRFPGGIWASNKHNMEKEILLRLPSTISRTAKSTINLSYHLVSAVAR